MFFCCITNIWHSVDHVASTKSVPVSLQNTENTAVNKTDKNPSPHGHLGDKVSKLFNIFKHPKCYREK